MCGRRGKLSFSQKLSPVLRAVAVVLCGGRKENNNEAGGAAFRGTRKINVQNTKKEKQGVKRPVQR
jgi:hypothetical protein